MAISSPAKVVAPPAVSNPLEALVPPGAPLNPSSYGHSNWFIVDGTKARADWTLAKTAITDYVSGTHQINAACFSGYRHETANAGKDLVVVVPGRAVIFNYGGAGAKDSDELPILRFWIRFLRHWLCDLDWSVELITIPANAKGNTSAQPAHMLVYRLRNPGSVSRAKVLLYLTAFRYPAHYCQAVHALWEDRHLYEDPDDLFGAFQQIHRRDGKYGAQDDKNPYSGYYHVDGGHGLMSRNSQQSHYVDGKPQYRTTYRYPIVSIDQFRKAVKDAAVAGVNSHFCTTSVAIVPPPVPVPPPAPAS